MHAFARRLDFFIIAALSLALIAVVVDQYVLEEERRYDTIAVLPFKSLSGDPEQEYFVEGMTDTLIATLGQLRSLSVISRTSVMRYKGSDEPLQSIAAALGANILVEASAQRAGDRILINAKLFDGEADRQIWARSFEEDYENVLKLQSNMAQEIVDGIRTVLTPEEEAKLDTAEPVDPDAYDAYLKGFSHLYRMAPNEYDLAEGYFRQVTEIDPDSVLGWVGLATVWGWRAQTNAVPGTVAAPLMREYAERAASIDDEVAEVHAVLGHVAYQEHDFAEAEARARRALKLAPNDARALIFLATIRGIFGDQDTSLELTARSMQLDPYNPFYRMLHAVHLVGARRYEESIVYFREVVEMAPYLDVAWLNYASCLHFAGRFDEVIEPTREWLRIRGRSDALAAFEKGLADGGYEVGMRNLADALAQHTLATGTEPITVARHYGYAGDAEKVIEWIERAYELGDPNVAWIRMPGLDFVRDDPRILALMEKMGI